MSDLKKILFLSPVAYFKGGAERSLFDLMNNPLIKPILIVPEQGALSEKATLLNIEYYILPFGSIHQIHRPFSFIKSINAIADLYRAAKHLKKISNQTNTDIIHSNGLKAHAINCFTKILFRKTKAVLHIRDIPYTKSEKLVWKILSMLSTKMTLVSRACWPFEQHQKKVITVYNATPLIETDNQIDISVNKPLVIGFIGRIHPAKGLHLLLNWIASLGNDINIQMTIRGEFSEDAPDYQQTILEQIQNLELTKKVTFTGFIADPNKVYAGIHLVAVPSEVPDPLPRSVMESMARGIPVIGYPAGGISEMIHDYKTGFMVKDAVSFKQVIDYILQNPHELKHIIHNAQEHIKNNFSPETLYNNMNEIYNKL